MHTATSHTVFCLSPALICLLSLGWLQRRQSLGSESTWVLSLPPALSPVSSRGRERFGIPGLKRTSAPQASSLAPSKPTGGSVLSRPQEEGDCSLCSSHFLVGSDFGEVPAGLRGLIGLQCVFVYCMSWKTLRPQELWVSEGTVESLLLLLPQLLRGDTRHRSRSFLVFITRLSFRFSIP